MTAASCIYCGTQAGQTESKKLSDEHIIPYALGGNLILPKASCDRCAKETHAFEGHLAGKTYEFARTHFHWKSRKRKRPARLKGGAHPPFHDTPVEEHPPGMVQPIFQPPRILLSQSPAEQMECIGVAMCFEPTFFEKIKNAKGISVPFQTDWLCRTFAKIAHSYSVLEHGLEKFEPFLIDIILGNDQFHYSYYIGNLASTEGKKRMICTRCATNG